MPLLVALVGGQGQKLKSFFYLTGAVASFSRARRYLVLRECFLELETEHRNGFTRRKSHSTLSPAERCVLGRERAPPH